MTTPAQIPASTSGLFDQQLAGLLADALAKAISAHAGTAWTGRLLPQNQPAPPAGDAPTFLGLRFTGAIAGELFLALHAGASAALLAALQTPSPQEPAQAWLTLASAAREILLETSTAPFATLAAESCQLLAGQPASQPLARLELSTAEGTPGALISLAASAALLASVATLQAEAAPPSADADAGDDLPAHIERVIDVPLAVTLRFGQRHLTLREVLSLSTGTLVELDRQVEEPVDLVLGDRLIARGEVVIVDGNYGLRVTEVLESAAGRLSRLGDGSEKVAA